MSIEFPKAYSPQNSESKFYEEWINKGLFNTDEMSDNPAYSILMPPPNITGILHFGHILNLTIQDLYIRRKRQDGFESCWFPGTDHAGIATQARLETELRKEGLSRYDLGREKFVERIWKWREKYGGIILDQKRKLGISPDWDRTIFTMDEAPSNAVNEVFIRLFDEGLIYRGKRIINWSPMGMTALSDEEVEFCEVKEHLYTMRYYYEDGSGYLMVATVRPETIFGDTAVAVNPNDERYKHLIGSKVRVPLCGRLVEVIADEYADPAFGTGCVKITPAHDPNDFLVGERHNLEIINSINPDGTLNDFAGEFAGQERFEARKKIVDKLKEKDLIEKIEEYTHNVGFSQRGGEPVEPYLSDQWFVKMKPLTEKALQAVQDGRIQFHPNHWVKTYEHWLTNIKDWCISRQLWWGHRIPVYYTEDGRFTAANSPEDARKKLGLDAVVTLRRDEDVLDTWFSSWLWPLTTMGWLADGTNEESPLLSKFLPSDLLVTAPDIIFFWVARMIMATLHFKNEIPFKNVYFTSLIRDGQGRKLSKSLGNSPDPLNVIDKYGADAVRFTMVYMSPLGQDVRMDVNVETQDIPSIEIGRNFCNKIWNAGRFLIMKRDQISEEFNIKSDDILIFDELTLSDKWIFSRLNTAIENINFALDNFKVNDYSKILYDFIWRDFCDWYVEIIKIQSNQSNDGAYKVRLLNTAIGIYENILQLIHPIMPFISEEIWYLLADRKQSISKSSSPKLNSELINQDIETGFELLQSIIEEIRKLRSTANIPPSKKVPLSINLKNEAALEFINNQKNVIELLSKCTDLNAGIDIQKPEPALSGVVRENEIYLAIGDLIDIEAEKNRLNKEIERLKNLISSTEKKLSNEKFVTNAAPEIVNNEREKLANLTNSLEVVKGNLDGLG
ncbi:MAG: valine--tRNA ligase [Candidatus Kapabacteria bacterium]|nr:valine--tRNA ligase [Ignavibacteriota bacterium]MCW5883660.1 valine--tRNA ligase [Candidatus Kapabacteria bacterium]